MNNRNLKVILVSLEICMQYLCLLGLVIICCYSVISYTTNQFDRCLIISLLVVPAYYFRKYVNNFTLFIFLHLILFVVALWYADTTNEAFFYFIFASALSAYSFSLKMNSMRADDECMPFAGLAIMVVEYVFGRIYENEILIQAGLIMLVFYISAQLIYRNLNNLNEVLIQNKETDNFPASQVVTVHSFMNITALIAMLVGMLSFYSGPYGNIFQIIGKLVVKVIAFFLKLLLKRDAADPIELPTVTEAASEDSSSGIWDIPPPDSFTDLINALFIIAAIMLIIAIFIALIFSIIKMSNRFGKKRKIGSDVVEFINPAKQTQKSTRIIRGKNLKEESESDLNLKLRKTYKRHIKKGYSSEKISLNALPIELTQKAITQDAEEVWMITNAYEKARYSNEKVNLEEFEKVKNVKITKPSKIKKEDEVEKQK